MYLAQKIINFFNFSAILGIFFLVPIFFAWFPPGANVFELPKMAIFKILLTLLFVTTVSRIFTEPWREIFQKLSWRQRLGAVSRGRIPFLAVLVFVFLAGVSVLTGQDARNSFLGSYERQQGFLSLVLFGSFFYLLIINLASRRTIEESMSAVALTSGLVSLYGLVQRAGWDPLSWIEPAIQTGRISSTLGQPNFLALYLVLVIPLVLWRIFASRKFLARFFFLVILAVDVLALYFTYSRSGWLGLAAGAGIALAAGLMFFGKKYFIGFSRKKILAAALLVLAGLGLLAFYLGHALQADRTARWRIRQMTDFSSGSVSARAHYWRASLDAIRERPWFGFGLENQADVFARQYEPEWSRFVNIGNYPDRAHNIFLDALLTGGIVGLIAVGCLMAGFFWVLTSNLKQDKEPGLSLAILSAGAGYFIALLFGFPTAASQIYFFGLFAAAAAVNGDYAWGKMFLPADGSPKPADADLQAVLNRAGDPGQPNLDLPDHRANGKNKLKNLRAGMIAAGGLAFFLFVGWHEINRLEADHYYFAIQKANQEGQLFTAIQLYDYIKETGLDRRGYDERVGAILADWAWRLTTKVDKHAARLELAEIEKSLDGQGFAGLALKAKIASALCRLDQPEFFLPAESSYRQVIGLNPAFPKIRRELARLYLFKKDYRQTQAELDDAVKAVPAEITKNFGGFQRDAIVREKYQISKALGDLNFEQKKYGQARQFFEKALLFNLNDLSLLKKIGLTCEAEKNYDCAAKYYQRGQSRNPKDEDWEDMIKRVESL